MILLFQLSQHLTRTRDSSRDEKNLYTTEPVKFKNEPRVLGDELDGGLVRQPLPISSTSERVLQEQELHNIQMYSRGLDYSQLAPERFTVVDEVSSSGQSSECFSASENLVSQEYCSPTKGSVTAHTADVISSQEKINHTDILRAETHRPPTTERLFISEEDYDRHKENWERRLETVPFKDDETIQSKESVIEGPDDNPTLVHEHYEQDTSCLLTPESSWENITQNEPQPARYESKSQEYLRDELNASNLADAEVTKTSLQSSHIEDDIVEEKYTTEYNVDMGKEIELSILEQSPAEEPICPVTARPNNGHIKYVTEIQNQPLLSTSDSYEVSTIAELTQGQELMKFTVAGGKKEEELYEPIELSWLDDTGNSGKRNEEKGSTSSVAGELSQDLKIMGGIYPESSQSANLDFVMVTDERIATHSVSTDLEDDSRGNLEKGKHSQSYDPANRNILETEPCRSVPDSAITNDQRSRVGMGNQSWSGVESQLAASASEANERVQMKERTGGEAMWGIRDNTRCLNVTPMDELFTCQDSVRYEESSVAERDRTVEAKADTAANIIKMTSGSTAEKMSAAEKAVIVKLPQETALSDRPTEEKETVFDIHEGRNDSSHYPLCQCNTEGVLYDTKYEKESVSDIYNARIHETVPGEMMSVCHTSEKLASAEQNTQIDSPFGEMVWTFALERKAISEQDLDSEAKQCAQQQSLYEEEAGRGSRGIFPNGSAKAKNHVSSSDSKIVASESSSPSCPEGSAEVCTAERGKVSLPYIDSSVQSAAQARCDFSPTNEIAHVIPNISFAAELQELPQSSAVFPSNEKAERSIGQLAYQLELNQGTLTRPTILISEPTDEREATSCESEDLTSDRKILNLDTEGHDSQLVFDHAEISGQQTEAHSLSAECQVLKHIGYKILYFLLFVVFCVTLYHYDLFVCFALYLFSLYWLYCEGRQNKEAVKKD